MASSIGKFQLHSGESILFDGSGAYVYEQNSMEHGRCILTSQRVVFCTHSKLAPGFLVKLLKLKATNMMFEIPLASVLSIEQKDPRIKLATLHMGHTTGDYTFSFLLGNKFNVRWVTSF